MSQTSTQLPQNRTYLQKNGVDETLKMHIFNNTKKCKKMFFYSQN